MAHVAPIKELAVHDHKTIAEEARSHIDALFAVMAKHGNYMMGGIRFKPEMRDTVIAIVQAIAAPLEKRIDEQDKIIQDLCATVEALKSR